MDFCDKATEREEFEREHALKHIRNAPQRDYEAEVCDGASSQTKATTGVHVRFGGNVWLIFRKGIKRNAEANN